MPSPFLEEFRVSRESNFENCRFIFVLDFAEMIGDRVEKEILEPQGNELFIRGKYGTPGETRNAGLSLSDAKYVAFWDVDDSPIGSGIGKLLSALKETNADVGIGAWLSLDDQSIKQSTPFSVGLNPGMWRFIFRREFIGNMKFSNLRWAEDQQWLAEVFERNPKTIVRPDLVYQYRPNLPGAQTSNKANVTDLQKSIVKCMNSSQKTFDAFRVCSLLMTTKQIHTLYKYGSRKMRLVAVKYMLSIVIRNYLTWTTFTAFLFYRKKWH